MTWVRVDDKALQHPKLLSAGAEGVCLWLAGLCHCNSFATDGVIRKEFVAALYPLGRGVARRVAARLVAVGLWKDAGTSFVVHDYELYQAEAMKEEAEAKAAEFEARRKRERERKRADRAAKRESVRGLSARTDGTRPNGHHPGQSADAAQLVPRARDHAPAGVTRPDPARPDPDLDLGGSAEFELGGAVLEGRTANGTAAAALVRPSQNITPGEVAAEWHRVGKAAWNALGWSGVLYHPLDHHRRHFEAIAAALIELPDPRLGLTQLVEYFWNAPHGPVRSGRVPHPTPQLLVEGMTRDLNEALAWKAGKPVARATSNGTANGVESLRPEYQPFPPMPPSRFAKEGE